MLEDESHQQFINHNKHSLLQETKVVAIMGQTSDRCDYHGLSKAAGFGVWGSSVKGALKGVEQSVIVRF